MNLNVFENSLWRWGQDAEITVSKGRRRHQLFRAVAQRSACDHCALPKPASQAVAAVEAIRVIRRGTDVEESKVHSHVESPSHVAGRAHGIRFVIDPVGHVVERLHHQSVGLEGPILHA